MESRSLLQLHSWDKWTSVWYPLFIPMNLNIYHPIDLFAIVLLLKAYRFCLPNSCCVQVGWKFALFAIKFKWFGAVAWTSSWRTSLVLDKHLIVLWTTRPSKHYIQYLYNQAIDIIGQSKITAAGYLLKLLGDFHDLVNFPSFVCVFVFLKFH